MKNQSNSRRYNHLFLLGLISILTGFTIFLDNLLKTGWLLYIILPLIGIAVIVVSLPSSNIGYLLAGSITLGIGWLLFFLFSDLVELGIKLRIGYGLLGPGISWLLIFILGMIKLKRQWFWVFIPSGLFLATSLCFILSPLRFVDFVLYIPLGLGLSFLVWGYCQRLLGLIIPGSLLVTIGPGIYFPWGKIDEPSGLSQTGMMLVIFALGWGLIVLFSRLLYDGFTWWPLIPGGILAVVGWGLYIGGNPQNAVSFIGNTGSLGLMIFGFYLLLMRRGFRQ